MGLQILYYHVFWVSLTSSTKRSTFQLRLPGYNLDISLSLRCRELRRMRETILFNLALKSHCVWQFKAWNSNSSSVKRNFPCLASRIMNTQTGSVLSRKCRSFGINRCWLRFHIFQLLAMSARANYLSSLSSMYWSGKRGQ